MRWQRARELNGVKLKEIKQEVKGGTGRDGMGKSSRTEDVERWVGGVKRDSGIGRAIYVHRIGLQARDRVSARVNVTGAIFRIGRSRCVGDSVGTGGAGGA
jgi:hypothetical protein